MTLITSIHIPLVRWLPLGAREARSCSPWLGGHLPPQHHTKEGGAQTLGRQPATASINRLIGCCLHFRVRMLEPFSFLGEEIWHSKMQKWREFSSGHWHPAIALLILLSQFIPFFKTWNFFFFGQEANASWYSTDLGMGEEGRECRQGKVLDTLSLTHRPRTPSQPPLCLLPYGFWRGDWPFHTLTPFLHIVLGFSFLHILGCRFFLI